MKSTDVRDIYDGEYFLNYVDGFHEFDEFDGNYSLLTERYRRNINLLELRNTHSLLEIGCGRGEICLYHANNGGLAKGIDFSRDAIEIAKGKAQKLNLKIDFIESSFDQLTESCEKFDRILASEFIEHISYDEGVVFFKSSFNMLKPGGKLLVYTFPNTLFRKYGYPAYRIIGYFLGKNLPRTMVDTTLDHFKLYHLNELNYFSLSSFVKNAGFKKYKIGYDIDCKDFSFKSLLKYIINRTPLRHIFFNNLYVVAEK